MKPEMLGVLVGAWLATSAVGAAETGGEIFSHPATAPVQAAATGSELIVVPTPLGDKALMLTVVDPRQQALSVYHIDLPTGKIMLKSVRKIQWDLLITDFNTENPLPQEIRSRLQQR